MNCSATEISHPAEVTLRMIAATGTPGRDLKFEI